MQKEEEEIVNIKKNTIYNKSESDLYIDDKAEDTESKWESRRQDWTCQMWKLVFLCRPGSRLIQQAGLLESGKLYCLNEHTNIL